MTKKNQQSVLDWVDGFYKRYMRDSSLILKIECLLEAARIRADFPFCREDVDASVQRLSSVALSRIYNDLLANTNTDDAALGERIEKQLSEALKKTETDEDELIDAFVAELTSLLIIYEPVLQGIASMESVLSPNTLKKINFLKAGSGVVMRIISNDGCHMDTIIPTQQLGKLAQTFKRVHTELGGEESTH